MQTLDNQCTMNIGEVARRSGVNVHTVRFYERKGLVVPDGRSAAGYREFSEAAIRRIRFIKHAQEVGFSLSEVDALLRLRLDPSSDCADVRQLASAKIAALEERIEQLEKMKSTLSVLAQKCDDGKPLGDCPILDAFDEIE